MTNQTICVDPQLEADIALATVKRNDQDAFDGDDHALLLWAAYLYGFERAMEEAHDQTGLE